MILGYRQLKQLVTDGCITGTKLNHIQPASIDISLGNQWLDVITGEKIVANYMELCPSDQAYESFYRLAKRFRLPIKHRRSFIIAETQQRLMLPYNIAGDIKLKSTPSRAGLDVSMGGWIDPGYCGTLSIVIRTYRKIVLREHEAFCQIVFHQLAEDTIPYAGKYQNSDGPIGAINYGA